MSKRERIEKELEQIRVEHAGVLRAADVVAFARNKKTALHSKFEWDDGKAGEAYRIWQARQVIECYVTVVRDDAPAFRAYVSLREDRTEEGGGYRRLEDVLSNAQRRKSLLGSALQELDRFQENYQSLTELADVFKAINRTKARVQKKAS